MSTGELLCADTIAEYKESIASWDEGVAIAMDQIQSSLETLYEASQPTELSFEDFSTSMWEQYDELDQQGLLYRVTLKLSLPEIQAGCSEDTIEPLAHEYWFKSDQYIV